MGRETNQLLRLVDKTCGEYGLVRNGVESASGPRWSLGVETIDACLPQGGLSCAGLHEIEPLRPTDMPSLTGFAFALLSRLRSTKPIVWCVTNSQIGDYGQPYAFGLSRFGISPSQIIFARVAKDKDLPFALEEAIKTEGVGAVIGEGERPCFTGSRRIALLCKTHKVPCLFMAPKNDSAKGSAALTRFQITPLPGVEDPHDPFGPGLPHWRMALPRVRAGFTTPSLAESAASNSLQNDPWRLVWDDQTLSFRAASVSRRAASPESGNADPQPQKTVVGR